MVRLPNKSWRGFTLLEVLLATMIMASVFVAVMGLLSQSLRNIDRLKPQQRVLQHATQKMNEVLVWETLVPGTESGSWEDGCRWRLQIAAADDTPPQRVAAYGLFHVQLEISWGSESVDKSYTIESFQWARRQKQANQ